MVLSFGEAAFATLLKARNAKTARKENPVKPGRFITLASSSWARHCPLDPFLWSRDVLPPDQQFWSAYPGMGDSAVILQGRDPVVAQNIQTAKPCIVY